MARVNPPARYGTTIRVTNPLGTPAQQDAKARATFISERSAGREASQATRDKFTDLYNQVGSTITDMTNKGREREAAQLRDAAERFARAGSDTGVSSEERVASLQKLAGTLRVQSQSQEAATEFKGIGQSLDILNSLANLDSRVLNESLSAFSATGNNDRGSSQVRRTTQSPTQRPRQTFRQPTRTPARPTRPVNPYFAWRTKEAQNASNSAASRNFALSANRPSASPFSNWSTPTDNRPRQWGETFSGGTPSVRSNNPIAGDPGPKIGVTGDSIDFKSPSVGGGYQVDPLTGKKTLVATGKRPISGLFDINKGSPSYVTGGKKAPVSIFNNRR